MGHGSELIFASVFLHRALSGSACQYSVERPLYAWIGFYVIIYDLRLSYKLITSVYERQLYADAKGGGHWMDFSRLADEYFGVPLEAVAGAFALLCLLPPILGLATSWLRPELRALRGRLGEL